MLPHSTTAMRLTALHTESNTGCFTPLLCRDYQNSVYGKLASSDVSCDGVSDGKLLVPAKDVKFPHEQEPSLVFLFDQFFRGTIEEKPLHRGVCHIMYFGANSGENRSLGSAQKCRTFLEVIPHPVSWTDIKNRWRE